VGQSTTTVGAAYLCPGPLGGVKWTGDSALGAATADNKNGDGFAIRFDGDFGASAHLGFYHQELLSGGGSDEGS
jgi:hypothetical protein